MTLFLSFSYFIHCLSFISSFSFYLDSKISSNLCTFLHSITSADLPFIQSCYFYPNFLICCSFYFIPPHYTVLIWYSPLKINNPILYSLYFCGDYFPFLFSFIFILIYHTVFSSLSSMLRPVSSALDQFRALMPKFLMAYS